MICNKHGVSSFSLSGIKRPRWKCKKCLYDTSKNYLYELKIKCINYKGGRCENCGYEKCSRSMHFHHIDPSKKDFSIGDRNPNTNKNVTKKWDLIKNELDKCLLLCSNCHYELHEKLDTQQKINSLGIHRKNINLINTHILKGRYTPEQMMEKINSGAYDTPEKLNHRELLHKKWLEEHQ